MRTLTLQRFDEIKAELRPRDALGALGDLQTIQPYARTAEDTRLMMGGFGKWVLGIGFDEVASPFTQWFGPTAFQTSFGVPLVNQIGFAGVGDRSISHVDGAAAIISPVTTPTTQFDLTATSGLGLFGLGYIDVINAALRTVLNKWDTGGGGKGYGVFIDTALGIRGSTRTDVGVFTGVPPPIRKWFTWGYVVDRATGKQRAGTREVVSGATVLTAEANVSATNETNAFAFQIGSGAGLGAMPMQLPCFYIAHGVGAGDTGSANLGDVLASFCTRVQSVPTLVDAAAGRGRSFVALSRNGYEAADVTAGATLSTRNCSVQALVRWDLLEQGASMQCSISKLTPTGAFDAGASSIQTIVGDGYIEFTVDDVDKDRAIGFTQIDNNQDHADILFAWYLTGGAELTVRESGALKITFGIPSYVAGDVFRIERVGTTIRYYQNNVLKYTSLTANGSPLRIDTALYTNAADFHNIKLVDAGARKAITWQNLVGVLLTPTDNIAGTIYARGKATAAAEYLGAGVELRVANAALGVGELRWLWQDTAGALHRQAGGYFAPDGNYIMLTATRRWVSSTKVVLRYFLGDRMLAEVESFDGSIGGGTTGTTIVGARFDGTKYVDFLDGVIDELRVVDYELAPEEIAATWARITKYQPRGYELLKQMHPPGFPISGDPSSRVQRETNMWGQSLGFAAAQGENLRNLLPDRAFGKPLEEWETTMEVSPKTLDDLDTRRGRVLGRLRQRAGVSIPGVKEALKGLIGTSPDNLEILAFSQEMIEQYDRPAVWSTGLGVLITKTGGANGNLTDNTAYTSETLAGDGYVEINAEAGGTAGGRAFGFSEAPGATTLASINWAFYLLTDGTLRVYELGVDKGLQGSPYVDGDILRVERVGTTIRYRKNGVIVYTSATASLAPVLVDTVYEHIGGTSSKVRQLRFVAVENTQHREIGATWNVVNTTVTPAHYTPFRDGFLKKTAADGWGTGGSRSVETIAGDGYVESTVVEINKSRFIGFSATNPDASFTSIAYGLFLEGTTSEFQVWENNVQKFVAGAGTVVANDVVRVERIGTTVYYKRNGVTLYTSTAPSLGALMIDTAFFHVNGTLQKVKLVDAGARRPITWSDVVGLQAYADATRVQGANAEDLQLVQSKLWRTALASVSSSPQFKTSTFQPGNVRYAEGWGAHLLTKIEPIALPNRGEVGIALHDDVRNTTFLFGLRNDVGTFRIITERIVDGVSQVAVNRAVTSLAAHWLHLFVQAPLPIVGGAINNTSWDFTAAWSTTGPYSGYTSYAGLAHTARFQWAALYARSFGGTLTGALDAYFDETHLFTPYGDRSLRFFVFRNPALAGAADQLGANAVIRGLKHAHTNAALITSKELLYDTDGQTYDGGPLGGY